MAQIINITSEALQRTIRRLLPSQQGFGEDLQASNVIQPIIDLTPTAEGDDLRPDLQTALAFGNQTSFTVTNTTTTIINTTGFWRIFGVMSVGGNGGTAGSGTINMVGTSTKRLLGAFAIGHGSGQDATQQLPLDFNVFLKAGESVSVTCNVQAQFDGTVRQLATINGTIVDPDGYTPQ
jgi:hypothetical protein